MVAEPALPIVITPVDELIDATLVLLLLKDLVPPLVLLVTVYALSPYVLVVGVTLHVGVALFTVCVPVQEVAL